MPQNIYQFSVKTIEGKKVPLSKYKDKVLLIVNTASKCGLAPQLEGLEALRREFKKEGFEILGFPSNDFMGQEPLEGTDIQLFCELNYNTTFPLFDKIHVKGSKQHELYQFLSSKKQNGKVGSSPRWNFHKYLINRDGEVVNYFYPITRPDTGKVKRAIKKLL